MQNLLNLINEIPGLVIFTVSGDEFCIDVKDVKFIVKYSQVFTGMFTPEVRYSDQDFKIIDAQAVFSNVEPESNNDKRIILCKIFGKNIGIIVDEVKEFLTFDSLFIQKNIEFTEFGGQNRKWILQYQNRQIFYPDYEFISKNIDGLLSKKVK